ncbi:glycoside hydrolase family 16 protein [Neolewinella antarctica]|uniref:Beta-glucanase (GH16 family) n=1 Tax=Neolewinella antarctica TaxID=442734 RepID=A0ABX0XAH4_9BACT|nr:glycoside hydrolase family 16 protein [Neolewinella antarctica]NJC26258.1 beta-glucanase (GH16 family) [Neolewinella antarctica]
MDTLLINSKAVCRFLGILTIATGFAACDVSEDQQLDERSYELVWSDDFDGAAGELPSAANWTYDIGNGPAGWGNNELQMYTDNPENVSLDGNGNLLLTAIRIDNENGDQFTSARIKTEGLFTKAYGRFEARLKTPYGPGIWPAFWLLGDNCNEMPWPQCGEIDIMELRGQEPNKIAGSVHGPGYSAGQAITADYTLENGRFDAEFRIFAIEWGEDYIDYFVDDFLYQRITKEDTEEADDGKGEWVYDHPFYIIMNVAVGGNYVGFPVDATPFPQTMTIDYVRVYEER